MNCIRMDPASGLGSARSEQRIGLTDLPALIPPQEILGVIREMDLGGVEPNDVIHVDGNAPLDHDEAVVQEGGDIGEILAHGVHGTAEHRDQGMVSVALHLDDVILEKGMDVAADVERQDAQRLLRAMDAVEHLGDILRPVRLDEVVDRIDAEGVHGVIVAAGGERDPDLRLNLQELSRDLDPVLPMGQEDIKEYQIKCLFLRGSKQRIAGFEAGDRQTSVEAL